jgi:hypothetical protein
MLDTTTIAPGFWTSPDDSDAPYLSANERNRKTIAFGPLERRRSRQTSILSARDILGPSESGFLSSRIDLTVSFLVCPKALVSRRSIRPRDAPTDHVLEATRRNELPIQDDVSPGPARRSLSNTKPSRQDNSARRRPIVSCLDQASATMVAWFAAQQTLVTRRAATCRRPIVRTSSSNCVAAEPSIPQ